MVKNSLKYIIYDCIKSVQHKENKIYVTLKEIYEEVSNYLEVENDVILQSQIRGRLQENCEQYSSFKGEPLFLTEKVKSGNWAIKITDKKYIREKNNKYIISNNNWLNSEVVNSISNDYELEENKDIAYQEKLKNLIGIKKSKIIIKELIKIRILLKEIKGISRVNEGYGTAFEVFSISTLHNITYEECINKYIVHGDQDGKIDAIYYDAGRNIFIYQIKIGNINDTAYNEMELNYNLCINENTIPNNGKDLYDFITSLKQNLKNKNPKFKSISDNSNNQENIKPIEIYQKFFENKLLPLYENNLELIIKKPRIDDSIVYNVSTDGNNNFNFFLKAGDLITYLIEALGLEKEYNPENIDLSKYFTDNVRGVLSTNKKMVSTIEEDPENFVKYNNGINITGEVEDLRDKIIIRNPIINNGQQTITTLIKINKNLDRITLPIKISNETKRYIKGKISEFSNDQVKVKAVDMLSLNVNIREIQKEIFETSDINKNYFLNIYSSGKKEYSDIIRVLYEKNNIIDLLDFIKLYFSVKNKKELGLWKNNPNSQINKTLMNKPFDRTLSFKVCESISRYENILLSLTDKKEKDNFRSSDLAFKYLICKENLTDEEAQTIINNINQEYFYKDQNKKSKLIDIYKSNTVINKLENELEKLKESKKNNNNENYITN